MRRIAVLLFALARVATRAGAMPFPVRIIVLAILRRAEAVAWAFALGTACIAPARGRSDHVQHVAPAAAQDGRGYAPADAARLALSLQALALIVVNCAIQLLSSLPEPSSTHRTVTSNRARPCANWRGPGALPAPDTS